jgi:hypothetical protein
MHRVMFVLVVAVSLWLLCSEAVTRDHFIIRSTQDLVEICLVPEKDPLHAALNGALRVHFRGEHAEPHQSDNKTARVHERLMAHGVLLSNIGLRTEC